MRASTGHIVSLSATCTYLRARYCSRVVASGAQAVFIWRVVESKSVRMYDRSVWLGQKVSWSETTMVEL